MKCTLLLPFLLPHGDGASSAWQAVDAPHLKLTLARAAMTHHATRCALDTLCALFSLRHHEGRDWPLAPLLARADGVDSTSGFWFTATPVHLRTQRHGLTLTEPGSLHITETEAAAFVQALSQHLNEEGITLHAPCAERWYLHCGEAQSVTTHPLHAALGRDVRPALPQGEDSRRWHRTLTEIQMLLHNHPANTQREARGLLPVNSVWLSLSGAMPPACISPFDSVWSDDPNTRALALHANKRHEPLPARFASSTDNPLYVFEALSQSDGQAWAQSVLRLERTWFAPLLEALRKGEVSVVEIYCGATDATQRFTLRKHDLWKIWRKNKYL